MASALLALALIGHSLPAVSADPGLDAHITYSTVAASAKDAIDGLAKASGESLKASATVKPSILLLRFVDVPLREAMKRIADACGGSWVADSGSYFLTRTEADEAKIAAKNKAELKALVKSWISDNATAAAGLKAFTSDDATALAKRVDGMIVRNGNSFSFRAIDSKLFRTAQVGPGMDRLATRVYAQLNPDVVLGAPEGTRTVYSTDPTQLELPLSLDLTNLAGKYVQDQTQWADAAQKFPDEAVLSTPDQKVHTAMPTKLDLVVDKSRGIGVMVGIELIGPQGEIVGNLSPEALGTPQPRIAQADKPTVEKPLGLSADDAKYLALFSGGPQLGASPPPSPEVRELALHPDKHEPLASYVSDLLVRAAGIKGLNIAADLPDDYLLRTLFFGGKRSAQQLLDFITALDSCPAKIDGDWLVIGNGGHLPKAVYRQRTDRVELAKLFASSTDAPSIEALAQYAVAAHPGDNEPLFRALYGAVFGQQRANVPGVWKTLELVGDLLNRYGDTIPASSIPFASLDPASLDAAETAVFGADPRFQAIQRFGERGFGGPGTLEPRDVLPKGLPRDGFLSVTTVSEDAVFGTGARQQAVNPFMLAINTNNAASDPSGEANPFLITTSSKFRTGKQRRLNLVFHFTPELSSQRIVEETHLTPGTPIPYADLPASFRKEVDDNLARLRQQGQ